MDAYVTSAIRPPCNLICVVRVELAHCKGLQLKVEIDHGQRKICGILTNNSPLAKKIVSPSDLRPIVWIQFAQRGKASNFKPILLFAGVDGRPYASKPGPNLSALAAGSSIPFEFDLARFASTVSYCVSAFGDVEVGAMRVIVGIPTNRRVTTFVRAATPYFPIKGTLSDGGLFGR